MRTAFDTSAAAHSFPILTQGGYEFDGKIAVVGVHHWFLQHPSIDVFEVWLVFGEGEVFVLGHSHAVVRGDATLVRNRW